MPPRDRIILHLRKTAVGGATLTELASLSGLPRSDALVVLGIMARCGDIKRGRIDSGKQLWVAARTRDPWMRSWGDAE